MQKTHSQSDLPRDSVVVEYVAGVLSKHAQHLFERKLTSDPALREAVQVERALRAQLESLAERNTYTAVDNFSDLLQRIEREESLAQTNGNEPSGNAEKRNFDKGNAESMSVSWFRTRRFNVYSMVASVAIVGVVAAMLLQPIKDQFLAANYQGLSDAQVGNVDLPSMVTQARIAKVTLAQSMPSQAVSDMLAGYQLELISHMPEQNGLIVLAKRSINPDMINGWRHDTRIANAELVSLDAKKK